MSLSSPPLAAADAHPLIPPSMPRSGGALMRYVADFGVDGIDLYDGDLAGGSTPWLGGYPCSSIVGCALTGGGREDRPLWFLKV